MQEKVIQLQAELEHALEHIGLINDPIRRCVTALTAVENSIKGFLQYIRSYAFDKPSDEISYFKIHAPYFFSKYLYFTKIQQLEILRRNSTAENTKKVLNRELAFIDDFTNRNADFLAEYYQGSFAQDERIFTRYKNPDNWILNDFSPSIPRNFSAPSTLVAMLLANEKVRCYIDRMLKNIDNPEEEEANDSLKDYTWEGAPKAAAWELFNKLAEKKIIYYQGGPADKKKVAEFLRLALNIQLGNVYEIDRKNRVRKKEQYPFLKSLLDDSSTSEKNAATR